MIIDAAEKAAASVIDDAEEQARHHLEGAQVRADRIIAEHLRNFADQLDPPGASERSAPPLRSVEPAQPVETAPARRGSESAGARLLATQMAVSGSSREEIETRLRSGFEIEDTGEILDAILGPEE